MPILEFSRTIVLIYKHYFNNNAELLRPDLDFVLSNSLNQINRTVKKNKFAFSTSEDALTWSFFKYHKRSMRIINKELSIQI